MNSPAISVVITVYNQEKYIGKCIRSVLSQSFRDFEVIIVNDGSTDKSLKYCQRYAKKDSRISIIDKKNEGVAFARKEGFLQAKGDYICFVDGDDYLVPNVLKIMYQLALEKQVDMVVGCFDYVYDNWGILRKGQGFKVSDRMINRDDILPSIAGVGTAEDWWAVLVWGKIFRRSCILRAMNESPYPLFPSNCRLEDHAFHLAIAPFIQSVWISSAIVAHYRYGGDTSHDYPYVRKGSEYFDNQFHCCIQHDCVSKLPRVFQNYMSSLIHDVISQVHFHVSSEAEIKRFLLREFSQRKIVVWAQQHSSMLPKEMLNETTIQSVLTNDAASFLQDIMERELLSKRHYRRMKKVGYYQKIMDKVGQLTDWIYRLN